MKSRYGQYCPVSLATEILGERWTILIILVLCDGITRFNDMQRFVDAWRGFRSLSDEVKSGRIKVAGPPAMRKAFPQWLLLSAVAHVDRQRCGRERNLQRRTNRRLAQ